MSGLELSGLKLEGFAYETRLGERSGLVEALLAEAL